MSNCSTQYFFIIGAMKAGTTSLYHYLSRHPDIYASPTKEPRILRSPLSRRRTARLYDELFPTLDGQRWAFEASTDYSMYPAFRGVPERIQRFFPQARCIYLVRDPVERVCSQYLHNLAHGRETREFARAILKEPRYLDNSRYYLQVSQYLEVFPRNRLLVLVFEEMRENPEIVLKEVARFLRLDSDFWDGSSGQVHNASANKRMASWLLRMLRRVPCQRMVPSRIRHWAKQRGGALPRKDELLVPDVKGRLLAALRDDIESFVDFFDRELKCWESVRQIRGEVASGLSEEIRPQIG